MMVKYFRPKIMYLLQIGTLFLYIYIDFAIIHQEPALYFRITLTFKINCFDVQRGHYES